MSTLRFNWPSIIIFAVIVALFGIALHKIDVNSFEQQAKTSSQLAYKVCNSRNAAITESNKRWNDEKAAWTAAALARNTSGEQENNPILKKSDRIAAAEYQQVANDIVPYPLLNCGTAP